MFKTLKRWLSVPTPSALPMAFFLSDEEAASQYTWEKWEAETKPKYPVRWFLTRTLPTLYSRYVWGDYAFLSRLNYWLKCHFLKEYRFHLLDLRQEKNPHEPKRKTRLFDRGSTYRFGYIDPELQILFACFKVLKTYVDESGDRDPAEFCSQAEIDADVVLQRQQLAYREIMELYRYWTIEHPKERYRIDHLDDGNQDIRNLPHDQRFAKYLERQTEEEKFYDREDEMLIRLIQVRRRMWT